LTEHTTHMPHWKKKEQERGTQWNYGNKMSRSKCALGSSHHRVHEETQARVQALDIAVF
jgi:hypothetical protein